MNRIIIYLCVLFTTGWTSCKKDLEERFYNPDMPSEGTTDIGPGLFARTITENKIFVQDYGEWYYLLNGGTSITGYAQIAQRYISYRYDWFSSYNDLTTGNGFDDFPITSQSYFESSYRRLKTWDVLRNEVELRTGEAKTNAETYFQLVSLVKAYQSAKLVDLFNSIPYFNAFRSMEGSEEYWYPKYDDPAEIYKDVIAELGRLAQSIPQAFNAMAPLAQQELAKQDVAFKGDMTKWVQFANATRLKLLVRISGVEPDYAKPLIQETLASNLPAEDLMFPIWYDTDQRNGGGYWMRGLYENTYASFIPPIILKRLNYGDLTYEPGIDDPRLPVIAMPTKHGDYRGISLDIDSMTPIYDGGERYYPFADNLPSSLEQNAFSLYNFATLHRNDKMAAYMFSLAELDLLLAEIALKNLATTAKTADEYIRDAVTHSTHFWYALNMNSDFRNDNDAHGAAAPLYPEKPDDGAIAVWADKVAADFTAGASEEDKMEILMQQKYIHLNLLHPYELWAELRRTGHPQLEPFTWRGSTWTPFPERVRYPTVESQNNAANLSPVSDQNNMTSKIFWVPANRNPNLYRDSHHF